MISSNEEFKTDVDAVDADTTFSTFFKASFFSAFTTFSCFLALGDAAFLVAIFLSVFFSFFFGAEKPLSNSYSFLYVLTLSDDLATFSFLVSALVGFLSEISFFLVIVASSSLLLSIASFLLLIAPLLTESSSESIINN